MGNLSRMEQARKSELLFDASVPFRVLETWDDAVLCLVRESGEGHGFYWMKREMRKNADCNPDLNGI